MSIIKTVTYQATVSTYAGCNESVKLSAEIEAGEELETVLKDLKIKAHEHLNDSDKYGEYAESALELQQRFRQIQKQVADAESYWISVTQFMKTQGIKSDFPDFPKLSVNNFLPTTEIIDGEF